MQAHFVTFYSPGTFFPEEATKPIDSWNPDTAVEMARRVTERYSATPFGFRFTTRAREDDELDSKVIERSQFYWLGGRVETREEVMARDDPDEEILRANMKSNDYKAVVVNDNSWRWTAPLEDGDVVLDVDLKAIETGTSPDLDQG